MRKCFFLLLTALSIFVASAAEAPAVPMNAGAFAAIAAARDAASPRPGTRPRRCKKPDGFATTVIRAGSYTGADAGADTGTGSTGQGSTAIIAVPAGFYIGEAAGAEMLPSALPR
jgi:hypothetical protein